MSFSVGTDATVFTDVVKLNVQRGVSVIKMTVKVGLRTPEEGPNICCEYAKAV